MAKSEREQAQYKQEAYQGNKPEAVNQDRLGTGRTEGVRSLVDEIDGLVSKRNLADEYQQSGGQ